MKWIKRILVLFWYSGTVLLFYSVKDFEKQIFGLLGIILFYVMAVYYEMD